jgi:hypothetical protein
MRHALHLLRCCKRSRCWLRGCTQTEMLVHGTAHEKERKTGGHARQDHIQSPAGIAPRSRGSAEHTGRCTALRNRIRLSVLAERRNRSIKPPVHSAAEKRLAPARTAVPKYSLHEKLPLATHRCCGNYPVAVTSGRSGRELASVNGRASSEDANKERELGEDEADDAERNAGRLGLVILTLHAQHRRRGAHRRGSSLRRAEGADGAVGAAKHHRLSGSVDEGIGRGEEAGGDKAHSIAEHRRAEHRIRVSAKKIFRSLHPPSRRIGLAIEKNCPPTCMAGFASVRKKERDIPY